MGSYSQERNEERMEKAPKKLLVDIFAIFATTRYCDPAGFMPVFPNVMEG
jgi:hypothetical protein